MPKKKPEEKTVDKTETPKIEKVKRVEVVKPASRLEIVRHAPKRPVGENTSDRPARKSFKRDEKSEGDRKFVKGDKPQRPSASRDFGNKKPIERRIISQDIYENKPGAGGNSKHNLFQRIMFSDIVYAVIDIIDAVFQRIIDEIFFGFVTAGKTHHDR